MQIVSKLHLNRFPLPFFPLPSLRFMHRSLPSGQVLSAFCSAKSVSILFSHSVFCSFNRTAGHDVPSVKGKKNTLITRQTIRSFKWMWSCKWHFRERENFPLYTRGETKLQVTTQRFNSTMAAFLLYSLNLIICSAISWTTVTWVCTSCIFPLLLPVLALLAVFVGHFVHFQRHQLHSRLVFFPSLAPLARFPLRQCLPVRKRERESHLPGKWFLLSFILLLNWQQQLCHSQHLFYSRVKRGETDEAAFSLHLSLVWFFTANSRLTFLMYLNSPLTAFSLLFVCYFKLR